MKLGQMPKISLLSNVCVSKFI